MTSEGKDDSEILSEVLVDLLLATGKQEERRNGFGMMFRVFT